MIIRTNENRLQETEMKVHQIKIDFHVTEQISRFVYVYIIEANSLYLVDSGVFGCEKQIIDYLDSIGRNISEIKAIFLTHAHPDHMTENTAPVKNVFREF